MRQIPIRQIFITMKYIIPQDKVDKIVFKYLDLNLKRLEKRKPNFYEGVVFGYPNEEYGIIGWENKGNLFICINLIDEISKTFGLYESDSKSIIGRWVSDRYQLEVKNTPWHADVFDFLVSDRHQLD